MGVSAIDAMDRFLFLGFPAAGSDWIMVKIRIFLIIQQAFLVYILMVSVYCVAIRYKSCLFYCPVWG
jgi:hypothetical protein